MSKAPLAVGTGAAEKSLVEKLRAKLLAMQEANETLESRVAQLTEILSLPDRPADPIYFSQLAGVIVGLVYRRGFASHETIMMMVNQDDDTDVSRQYVNVAISTLKKNLKARGIEIKTIRGEGLAMDDENKKKLDAIGYVVGTLRRRRDDVA